METSSDSRTSEASVSTWGTQPLLLTNRQVADATGFSQKTIWNHTAPRGQLACVKAGRAVRYTPAAVEHWLEILTVGAEAPAPNQPGSGTSAILVE